MPGDERPLPVVGAVDVVLFDLEELREGRGLPLGLADDDVGDGGPLDRAVPGEREARHTQRLLADQVVGVAHVRAVKQLRDRHVYPGALLDGLWEVNQTIT